MKGSGGQNGSGFGVLGLGEKSLGSRLGFHVGGSGFRV